MINMTPAELATLMGVPSAITAFCFWLMQRQINRRAQQEDEREEARKKNELLMIKSTGAAIALGEATARAMQRIPDAHCNGDMHAALEYATKIKHEQKDFLAEQGVSALFD